MSSFDARMTTRTPRAKQSVAIMGAQWGDEGKAKIIDLLAEEADIIVRCQGGCNAGHTVVWKGQTFKFHHLPSGLLYDQKTCLIGSGTVIHPEMLRQEIASMQERGIDLSGLKISDRAHITLPLHIEWEHWSEDQLGEHKIGTTKRGIGPTYMDKVGRVGVRVADLFDTPDILRTRLLQSLVTKPHAQQQDVGAEIEKLMTLCQTYRDLLAPYVTDIIPLLDTAWQEGQSMLFEGAQGAMLDVDFGTYPFVTSSNATAGGVCTGSGMGPSRIDTVIGVLKAYSTRVGEGPFPTELQDEMGQYLIEHGHEYGTTTGRQRRCGWFDAVAGRYSVCVNGLDSLAITKLDVLDGLDELKICVAYQDLNSGEQYTSFPAQLGKLQKAQPVYETLPGWPGASVKGIQQVEALPANAQAYLKRISDLLATPIGMISTGPDREETIILEHPLKTSGCNALAGCK